MQHLTYLFPYREKGPFLYLFPPNPEEDVEDERRAPVVLLLLNAQIYPQLQTKALAGHKRSPLGIMRQQIQTKRVTISQSTVLAPQKHGALSHPRRSHPNNRMMANYVYTRERRERTTCPGKLQSRRSCPTVYRSPASGPDLLSCLALAQWTELSASWTFRIHSARPRPITTLITLSHVLL